MTNHTLSMYQPSLTHKSTIVNHTLTIYSSYVTQWKPWYSSSSPTGAVNESAGLHVFGIRQGWRLLRRFQGDTDTWCLHPRGGWDHPGVGAMGNGNTWEPSFWLIYGKYMVSIWLMMVDIWLIYGSWMVYIWLSILITRHLGDFVKLDSVGGFYGIVVAKNKCKAFSWHMNLVNDTLWE